MKTDIQLGKAGRRETYVVESPISKTGGTVQLFSREGMEDLIPRVCRYNTEKAGSEIAPSWSPMRLKIEYW